MTTESNQGSGWLCVALVLFAYYCRLPDTLIYHQTRLLGAPVRASRGVIEAEVDRAAKAYKLPPKLLHALVRVESGYQAEAVSPVGARGLSQVMPSNHRRCGLHDAGQLFDPVSNLRCGALILRQELDRLGNLHDALTVYNCGRVNCGAGKQYAQKVISLFTKQG